MNDLSKQQNHSTSCANFDLEILNFQNLSTSCANFDLEILNFQNLICPFGLKHGVYTAAALKDFRIDEMGTNGGIGGGVGGVALINVTQTEYQYKYNGIEWQDELGLNMYAMDMRQYDPAIARWVVQDPVTHFDFSPYNAFDNNPVFWADPSGADAVNIGYDRVVDTNSFSGSATWSGGFREISGERKNDEVSANQNSSSNSNANSAQNLDNGDPKNSDQEKPKTYNINDKDFLKVKPTVTKQTALESIKSKLFGSSLNSSKNIINKFNPKKSPLTLSPESAENINNSNIIRDAKNRLITLGAGNAVTIDIYPSVMEGSPFFNVHPVGQLKITYDGNQEGKHIFTEEEKINHSKLIL